MLCREGDRERHGDGGAGPSGQDPMQRALGQRVSERRTPASGPMPAPATTDARKTPACAEIRRGARRERFGLSGVLGQGPGFLPLVDAEGQKVEPVQIGRMFRRAVPPHEAG